MGTRYLIDTNIAIYLLHGVLPLKALSKDERTTSPFGRLRHPVRLRFIHLNVHRTFTLRDRSFILIFHFENKSYVDIMTVFKVKNKDKRSSQEA